MADGDDPFENVTATGDKGMLMLFRTGLGVGLCASLVAVAGASVAAQPPIINPPERDDFVAEVTAEESCGDFGIVVEPVQGKTHSIAFSDGRFFAHAPGAKYQVSNAETGQSVVVQGSGAFHDGPWEQPETPIVYNDPDIGYEVRFTTRFTGHNVLFGPYIDDNGDVATQVLYLRGGATATVLFDFDTGLFTLADLRGGTRTDLCAALD